MAALAVHAGAVLLMLWAPAPQSEQLLVPTIQGVLVPAPPAEEVAAPSAKPKPEPRPKPKPKPKPTPNPKPKPAPPPPKAPPSERAVRAEPEPEPVEVQRPPPKRNATVAEKDKDNQAAGAAIVPPRHDANPLNNPAPAYPSASRRLREEGIVVLKLLILTDGRVGKVEIKESSGFKRLDETAIRAVKRWKYLPAMRGDTAIEYWYLQPLEFSLN